MWAGWVAQFRQPLTLCTCLQRQQAAAAATAQQLAASESSAHSTCLTPVAGAVAATMGHVRKQMHVSTALQCCHIVYHHHALQLLQIIWLMCIELNNP
jgi:hypothetical protein